MNKSQTPLYLEVDMITIKNKGVGINVYSNITLDCQTKAKRLFCEDCLARRCCKIAR